MWYTSGSGRIELQLTKQEAAQGSHPGDCDRDIQELSQKPRIARQLAKLDPEHVQKELAEYGAWDDVELSDHQQNLQRILWCACCEITEEAALGSEISH